MARFAVRKRGQVIFNRKYHAYGNGYFARTAFGGAFAMKSSMRATTDEALRSLFEQFLTDVNAKSTGWTTEDVAVPVQPVDEREHRAIQD